MHNKIVISFDFGMHYIGMAVGQTITYTANPLKIVIANNGNPIWQQCDKNIQSYKPNILIIGIPIKEKNANISLKKTIIKFSQKIFLRYNIPIIGIDERFTTKESLFRIKEYQFFNRKKRLDKKNNRLDSIAACLLIETWFLSNTKFIDLNFCKT